MNIWSEYISSLPNKNQHLDSALNILISQIPDNVIGFALIKLILKEIQKGFSIEIEEESDLWLNELAP